MDAYLECADCGAKNDLDADSLHDTHRPACTRCGGHELRRKVERRERRAAPAARVRDDELRTEPFPSDVEPADAEGHLWRGHFRAASGDLTGAIADAVRAVDLDPFLAPAWLLRGAVRLRQGDREGGASDLETFLRLAPEHPQAARTRKRLADLRAGRS